MPSLSYETKKQFAERLLKKHGFQAFMTRTQRTSKPKPLETKEDREKRMRAHWDRVFERFAKEARAATIRTLEQRK